MGESRVIIGDGIPKAYSPDLLHRRVLRQEQDDAGAKTRGNYVHGGITPRKVTQDGIKVHYHSGDGCVRRVDRRFSVAAKVETKRVNVVVRESLGKGRKQAPLVLFGGDSVAKKHNTAGPA